MAALNALNLTLARGIVASGGRMIMLGIDPSDATSAITGMRLDSEGTKIVSGIYNQIHQASFVDNSRFTSWKGERIPF